MRSSFKLFQSHLDLAHHHWRNLLQEGDLALDATCGNGHDTLVLARSILTETSGRLWALDIQEEALKEAQHRLKTHLSPALYERISWHLGCHSTFPPSIPVGTLQLIVYNLGYLPKGNKGRTTLATSTLMSLTAAFPLLKPGGMVSITCYPGHPEGLLEQEKILTFLSSLPPDEWSVCHHQWINRSQAPSLLLVQKAK